MNRLDDGPNSTMRFGQEFTRQQRPEWSPFYVNYDELKKLIKIIHGEAYSRGETPDLGGRNELKIDVGAKLLGQYQKANHLYQVERSRLDRIRELIAPVLGPPSDADGSKLSSVYQARQQVARTVLLYVHRAAKRLLLFEKSNSEAATRIGAKYRRAEGPSRQYDDVQQQLFAIGVRPSNYVIVEWTRRHLKSLPELQPLPQEVWHEKAREILEPFLNHSKHLPNTKEVIARARLCWIIQYAGFERSIKNDGEVTSHSHASSLCAPSGFWEQLIHSETELCQGFEPEFRTHIFGEGGYPATPLHYAAEYGVEDIVADLLEEPSAQRMLDVLNYRVDSTEVHLWTGDISPLTLAVCNGHLTTVDVLLSSMKAYRSTEAGMKPLLPSSFARGAIEVGNLQILEHILAFGVDINEQDSCGRLLLCTASRRNPQLCELLLNFGATINIVEPYSGRTVLGLACIQGDASLAKLLMSKGADPSLTDAHGWLPMEYAAYRGHFRVMALFEGFKFYDSKELSAGNVKLPTAPLPRFDRTVRSHVPWMSSGFEDQKGSSVWIGLGSNDATKSVRPIQVNDDFELKGETPLENETLYSLSVAVEGKDDVAYEWNLPMLQSNANDPWFLHTDKVDDLKLVWKLYRYNNVWIKVKELVGSGIALMGALNTGLRAGRESVVRDTTIPIQDPTTLAFVGTITFSYFWSTPHPPPAHLAQPHYWDFGNGIGGHRGSGKNKISDKKLQIGENTAQSFSTAVEHGAAFLEFDVQLTKDLVPVIYHDFLISETGTDSPMHALSLDQFNYLSHAQAPRQKRERRSNSLASADNGYLDVLQERMERTHFNKIQGFKANTRGNFIHQPTCSLEELFRHVPKTVRLNVEIKYPMLFETHEWDMEPIAIKTDLFVDTILDTVYEHAEGRTIVFSSFSPEICIALSTKQRSFPVFFLSKTAAPRGELRSSCVQQAVYFAKSWGLPGIVTECTPLIKSPRIIQYVRAAGLACTSFGASNSDPDSAKVSISCA